MKVTGFTIIKNAIENGYPVVEAIKSVLPLCDAFVVLAGDSTDDTRQLIASIADPKITIHDSTWDQSLRKGGQVLAVETNKAYGLIPEDSDWCFYIQSDEVVHEDDYPVITKAMRRWKDSPEVEGLLFNYLHFYGSFDFVATSYKWYRREVRIIRKSENIFSYRDAQGFRKNSNDKLRVKHIDARIFHYGWVRPPRKMQNKLRSFLSLYHSSQEVDEKVGGGQEYDYSGIDVLTKYEGSHPEVMKDRISNMDWQFDYDPANNRWNLKNRFKKMVEKLTGYRVGEFKNYRII